jgi:hypothetical protein
MANATRGVVNSLLDSRTMPQERVMLEVTILSLLHPCKNDVAFKITT